MFYKVEFSAESLEDAGTILDALIAEKLVTGGQFIEAPARFLWKGKVVNMNYVTTTSFTVVENRNAITEVIERVSTEDVPMICFIPFEVNPTLGDWIKTTLV